MKQLVVTALMTLVALAATARAATADTSHWYAVEVIVFRPSTASAGSHETWPAAPALPVLDNAVVPYRATRLTHHTDAKAIVTAARAHPRWHNRVIKLPAADYQLDSVWKKLKAASQYQTLMHTGWVEKATSASQAAKVSLTPLVKPEPKPTATPTFGDGTGMTTTQNSVDPKKRVAPADAPVFGTITLSDGSYLRLVVNTAYRPGDNSMLQTWQTTTPDEISDAQRVIEHSNDLFWDTQNTGPSAIVLNNSRRIHTDTLEYFDNPVFSLLVQVREIKPDNATP